nr:immunoglobulin light chain junction region [Macaca mulatta]MOV66117.1 immunoglobulin light chain junction region [Macaca mulatta]MOV66364.1 immunoglobulin light chain junction region [Macaca mulatta]MOV66372.1 immunoglobulin light chain junction region [Macaca mulatta]MOV66483.1 immunoglobulin light chain junction region [Macaca mulatta]
DYYCAIGHGSGDYIF